MTSINDLNNDCMREILLNIEVYERLPLRKVCKKWCQAVDDCWREVKYVKIMDVPSEESEKKKPKVTGTTGCVEIKTSGQKLIEGVLKRCGDVLTGIEERTEGQNNSGLPLAIKHCGNLKDIFIGIKNKIDDKNASQLFAANKKLEFLGLQIALKNAKLCFRKVPTERLEKMIFSSWGCGTLPASSVLLIGEKQVIGRTPVLQELITDHFDDELLGLIGEKKKLEKLGLVFVHDEGVTLHGLFQLLKLKSLKEIVLNIAPGTKSAWRLRAPPITDDYIMALAHNLPNLEIVDLKDAVRVTNKGFKSLASVEKLSLLRMINCPMITDEFLYLFGSIKRLDMVDCCIKDEGVIQLLENAETMRELNLQRSFITNKTLVAAVNATNKRENGLSLTLSCAGTKVRPEFLTVYSPLLKIVSRYDD